MASSKHHELEQISKKIEDIKNNYAHEIRSIKRVFEDSSVTINEIEEQLKELEGNQIEALATSDELRKQAIKGIEEYFDSIDAKILSFIQGKMENLEKKKLEIQTKFRESKSNWNNLERMINDNSRELLTQGEAMLEKMKNDQMAKQSMDFEKEKIVIEVAKGTKWDPITAATLSMRTEKKESQAPMAVSAKQPMQHAATGRNDLSFNLPTNKVAKQHASDTAPGDLSTLAATTKFKRIGGVTCSGYTYGLRFIKNQLWSCQGRQIEIFDKNLKRIKILQNNAWNEVYDVILMPNAGIVIACNNGLLHIDDAGDTVSEIDSGDFKSIEIYNGTLYASEYQTETIRSYTYRNGDWVKQGSLKLPRRDFNTISVKKDTITVCYYQSYLIDVLSRSGQQLHTYGRVGTKGAGGLKCPRLCQEDSEGALLVADKLNHRLQLLDKRRKWSIVDMEPKVSSIQRAVYVDDTVYVIGYVYPDYKLFKYIAK